MKSLITVKNFGPVRFGEMSIRPLTIIVGKNNTGKSYVVMAYYALFNSLRRISSKYFWVFLEEDTKDRMIKNIADRINRQGVSKEELIDKCLKAINDEIKGFSTEELSEIVKTEIERTFGTTIEELRRDRKYPMELTYKVKHNYGQLEMKMYETVRGEFNVSIKYSVNKRRILNKISREINNGKIKDRIRENLRVISKPLEAIVDNFISQRIYFLPASRSGILHSYKTIAASIIHLAPLAPIKGVNIPKMPGVVADFLNFLISLEPSFGSFTREDIVLILLDFTGKINTINKRKLGKLISRLEENLFEGSIELIRKTRIQPPELIYKFDGLEINIINASSMIAEMSPLDLLFKYGKLTSKDTLIIEEPEAHLHPDKQVKMAELLAFLVNLTGMNLIITTHSDIMLSKLSNLVRMGYIARYGKEVSEFAINKNKIGVYHFVRENDGVIIKPVQVTDQGIPDDIFYQIIRDLYEESMNIYYRIQEKLTKVNRSRQIEEKK